jgi:type IV pilus assembly protein PilB
MEPRNNVHLRIGDVLQEMGYVSDEQIAQALAYQRENKGVRMGDALIALGFISEQQMLRALAARLNYELVNISELSIDIAAVARIPKVLAEKYCMMGYSMTEDTYELLVNDPMNFYGIEDIRQIVGMEIRIALCEKASLQNAINYYYSEVSAKEAANRAAQTASVRTAETLSLDNAEDDTPIVNLLNSLILRAFNSNVSDIHIEPGEFETRVRMRMDGVITDFMTLQKSIHQSVIARIKILGDMDIAERRIPQDGHFHTDIDGQNLNIRVSVIPTVFGEKAVLRLLSSAAVIDHGTTFGMDAFHYEKVRRMLQSPNGIVYVTGPTGSGKSTTLYMILAELSKRSVNISTIEDPVEKFLPRLNQMQVNNQSGLSFEIGLRALLRQDPDIIMVGETRDAETASISVRAAITGHLVFSTLHTNDAASAVVRLADMGVEPYMIASALVGIIAQRLVRKVCPVCGEWDEMTAEEVAFAGRRMPRVMRARGCGKCNNTGYRGRIAVHEVLPMTRALREMIITGATTEEIKDYGVQALGMKTLKESALELVEQGVTTMEELMKVAYYD